MIASLGAAMNLFDMLADAVILVDEAGQIVFANRAVQQVLGYAAGELPGHPLAMLIPEDYRAQHERHVRDFQEKGLPRAMSQRPVLYARSKSGAQAPVSISISNLDIQGKRYSVAVVRDVSVVRDRLAEAIGRAESDTLTGVGNRLHLSKRIQKALAGGRPFGLLFLDLRHFKRINDEYGHKAGDDVLRLVARRIQALIRAADAAVRLGGDEFVILLDLVAAPRLLAIRAETIAASIAKPFRIDAFTGSISSSIGGALYPRDGATEDQLIAAADGNMYRARSAGLAYCIDPAPADGQRS